MEDALKKNLEKLLKEEGLNGRVTDLEYLTGGASNETWKFFFSSKTEKKHMIFHKKVIFFLAKTDIRKISLSHEHNDYLWLGYNDALKKITFENAKNILAKANKFLLDTSS